MPSIMIQRTELSYEEADVINFPEGLIGLPHLRRMVLVRQPSTEPFLWLASLDDPEVAFLVAEPCQLFPNYSPPQTDGRGAGDTGNSGTLLMLSLVSIAPDWRRSTVNLRAPLFISASTMRGAQIVLTDSLYGLNEPLPRELLAA